MRRLIGYVLLALSCLAWGVIGTLPFFKISIGEAAAATTVLIILGEASFLLGVLLLGKEAWEKIKTLFKRQRKEEAS